jgi:hypothetical protein
MVQASLRSMHHSPTTMCIIPKHRTLTCSDYTKRVYRGSWNGNSVNVVIIHEACAVCAMFVTIPTPPLQMQARC